MTDKTLIELVEEYGDVRCRMGQRDEIGNPKADALLTEIKSRLASMQGVAVLDTHVLVPKERTVEMDNAALAAFHKARDEERDVEDSISFALDAAIAAAPSSLRTLTAEEWERMERDRAEVAALYCPEAAGFDGPETFPDCGKCVVCRARAAIAKQEGGLAQGNEG